MRITITQYCLNENMAADKWNEDEKRALNDGMEKHKVSPNSGRSSEFEKIKVDPHFSDRLKNRSPAAIRQKANAEYNKKCLAVIETGSSGNTESPTQKSSSIADDDRPSSSARKRVRFAEHGDPRKIPKPTMFKYNKCLIFATYIFVLKINS